MMDCEVKEYFSILLEACHVEEISLDVAYRQLRELLERLCRTQMPDGSLQMTDLSARISFVASKAGLSTVEQNRLHTFRLTSNAILNARRNRNVNSCCVMPRHWHLCQALDGGGDTCRTLSPATPCGCHLYSGTARQRTDKAHARLFSVCR